LVGLRHDIAIYAENCEAMINSMEKDIHCNRPMIGGYCLRQGNRSRIAKTAEVLKDLSSKRFESAPMPAIVWIILGLLILSCAVNLMMFGKNLTGWAWIGGYAVAFFTFAALGFPKGSIPLWFWLPWVAMVLLYMLLSHHDYSVQNAVQMLCPLFVGYVASSIRLSFAHLIKFIFLMRKAGLLFLAILLFVRLPMLLSGILPAITGLAAESISSLIFQSFFLCSFLITRKKIDLALYLGCAAVPIVALTRGAIISSFLLATLCLAPLSMKRRYLIGTIAIAVSLFVFYSNRFQRKMFYSGEGTIRDLTENREDVKESGRVFMRELMLAGIDEHPWTGNGGNATWTMLKDARMVLEQPHNDWLRITYNYGLIGLAAYLGALLIQIWHAWRLGRSAPPLIRILFSVAASAFIPYIFLMYTDNILIYVQYFGNMHFLILGLAYGSYEAYKQNARARIQRRPTKDLRVLAGQA
jgi:O-antigen ligase